MRVVGLFILPAALCAAASAQTPAASACDLLTTAEVEAAAGWKSGAPESESYGTTSTCTFSGNALKQQVVVLTLARPAPKVASSAAFAERRLEQGRRTPELATKAEPVEGLGAPAIRSDDGSGPATIEAVTGGRLLGASPRRRSGRRRRWRRRPSRGCGDAANAGARCRGASGRWLRWGG